MKPSNVIIESDSQTINSTTEKTKAPSQITNLNKDITIFASEVRNIKFPYFIRTANSWQIKLPKRPTITLL